ncbi:hypothetical protein D3C87_1596820 [compost metagenome]
MGGQAGQSVGAFDADAVVLEALAKLGAPTEVLEQAQTSEPETHFEVFDDNWPTLEVFLQLATCWSWLVPPMGTPIRAGIPAIEIQATIQMLLPSSSDHRQAFRDIRAMESAALEVFMAAQ